MNTIIRLWAVLLTVFVISSGSAAPMQPSLISQSSAMSLGLYWSMTGPIPGKTCITVNEPADPHAWNDNYLCGDADYGFRWSYSGTTSGYCTRIEEPADPHAWDDNYLCSDVDYGAVWSYAGPVPGASCLNLTERADPHAWDDNFLCFTKVKLIDHEPAGALDPLVDRTVRGWALDSDFRGPGQHLTINIYLDGPVGVGTLLGTVIADDPSEPQLGGNGAIRFQFALPLSVDGAIHYLYAYARGHRPDGVSGDQHTLLDHSPRQTGTAAPEWPAVRVRFRDGSTFDTGNVIRNYALAVSNPRVNSVADEWTWSHKTWGEPAYSPQGSLIAKKLLSFGSAEDIRQVREWLLVAPIDTDNQIFSTNSNKLHLSEKGAFESNAEFIIMARDYLAFSGDLQTFEKTPDRLLCYLRTSGTWNAATPPGKYSACGIQDGSDTYEEVIFGAWSRGPGMILGQYFNANEPFRRLWLPLRARNTYTCKSAICSCSPPLRVYLNQGSGTVATYDIPSNFFSSAVGVEVGFPDQPAGTYYVEIHPRPPDSALKQCLETHPDPNLKDAAPYWNGVGWRSDAAPVTSGGATAKAYTTDPSGPVQFANLRTKLQRAMQWQLDQARNPQGSYGIFIIWDATFRGTGKSGVSTSTYYDLLKSGFKDTYVNLRFLESLDAYLEMQRASVAPLLVSDALRQNVETDTVAQLVQPDGRLISWIGCSYTHNGRSLCNPSSISDFQHPYDIAFVPSQALAARLIHSDPRPRTAFAGMRSAARHRPGLFRTNLIKVEDVTPDIWEAQHTWCWLTDRGMAVFAPPPKQCQDWHLFETEPGNGNWGYQEENGGILFSTTTFVLQAGPYPEMIADWQRLSTRIDEIVNHVGRGAFNVPLLAHDRAFLRRPIENSVVRMLCENGRPAQPADSFHENICSYYKSISYHLPEAGTYVYALLEGLLSLKIGTDGGVSVYGRVLTPGVVTDLDLASLGIRGIPAELASIDASHLNVSGRKASLSCSFPSPSSARCVVALH